MHVSVREREGERIRKSERQREHACVRERLEERERSEGGGWGGERYHRQGTR